MERFNECSRPCGRYYEVGHIKRANYAGNTNVEKRALLTDMP